MVQVTFKFDLDQWVVTPFGKKGIVRMQSIDKSGIRYFVDGEIQDDWFFEHELEPSEKPTL